MKTSIYVKILMCFVPVVFFASCTDMPVKQEVSADSMLEQFSPERGAENPSGHLLEIPDFELEERAVAVKSKANQRLFKRVLVMKPNGELPGSRGAPVVDNFADAISRVEPGGTITVFSGVYEIDEIVEVDRPVTIEAKNGGGVLIKNAADQAFFVSNVTGGAVEFNNLEFENPAGFASIVIINSTETSVNESTFDIGGTTAIFTGGDTGAKLTINESRITGGVAGTFASGAGVELNVHSSVFNDHSTVGVQHQGGAFGTVENNEISDCGIWGCARAVNAGNVEMRDNQFSDDIPETVADGITHHIVFFWNSTGMVEDNLFDGCGHGQCMAGSNNSVVTVQDNEFRIYEEHFTRFAIVSSDGFVDNPSDLTVTGNTVTGIGGNAVNNPSNGDAYAIKLAGIMVERLSRMEAHENSVVNAASGIMVSNGAVLSAAKDNTISRVRAGVTGADWEGMGAPKAVLKSNDITDYYASIDINGFDSGSDMTCNWWGTDLGPQNVHGAPASFYTPWATGSVAGSSVTSCSGGI